MNNEKPLLLIFPFGLLSHYLRCLVIANYLKSHFTIRFAAHPALSLFVEQYGFSVFQCSSINEAEAIRQLEDFNFSWLNEKNLEETLLDQVKVIEKYKPVAVLGDAVPTLKMAAEYTKTPYVSLLNGYMTKYYGGTRALPKKHSIQKILNVLPENLQQYFTVKGEAIAFKKIHSAFRIIRSKYNLASSSNYLDEIEGDYTLICDLPEMFPQKQVSPTHICVGPLVYKRATRNTEAPNLSLNPNKKTLYVTMGSSGSWERVNFLNDSHFSHYNIICSGDKKRVLHAQHIQHQDFIEPQDILPFTDLIICHGGNGTIYQALAYAIPLLCLPYHFEQEWNTDVLVKKGLAQTISPDNDHAALIEECIVTKQLPERALYANRIQQYIEKQPDITEQLFERLPSLKAFNAEDGYLAFNNN